MLLPLFENSHFHFHQCLKKFESIGCMNKNWIKLQKESNFNLFSTFKSSLTLVGRKLRGRSWKRSWNLSCPPSPLFSWVSSPHPPLLGSVAWDANCMSFKLYLCHLLSPAPPPLPRTSLNKASPPFTSLEASSSIANPPPAIPGEGLGLLDEGGDPRLRKHHYKELKSNYIKETAQKRLIELWCHFTCNPE